jgi:hypothetical protein
LTKDWFNLKVNTLKGSPNGGPFLFLQFMNMRFTVFIALCIIASQIRAQLFIGAGAAIHRYDQVLSFRMVKPLNYGGLGLDLGLGVERSLQGALAPQLALCFQAPMSASSLSKKIAPFYALRYQFDFQKSSFLDTYHGVYFGAGLGFGQQKNLHLYLNVGLVMEQIYSELNPTMSTHFFWSPQAQISYVLRKQK